MFLGVKGGGDVGGSGTPLDGGAGAVAPVMEVSGLPESFDWREKGAVTEVKTQVRILLVTIFFENKFEFDPI